MEKIGNMELFTHEEMLDRVVGEKGTSARAEFDQRMDEFLIGDAIRHTREANHLTQEQLGELMGVKRAQISKIESGKSITYSTIVRAFKAMGVKTASLDMGAMVDIIKNYNKYKDLAINDKYKHAMINCQAAQRGTGGALGSSFFAGLKELYDINSKNNTIDESHEDDIANNIGRYLGFKYPYGDCDEMVRKYIRK